ncbi:hypothetical protein BsIDN1_65040 [Bacillus safensis]|uniref:Release factor glutamine methyltransferase N-terminal domain-containing protein n=1 Tax=Bacillus safensis TaxID=561879 RepID=A0A5S9MMH6_BACIA|nr:hypothetical protein BsIDN1_65040 [Bacillus safensis]
MHVCGWSRSELLARFHDALPEEQDHLFSKFVTQHKAGVPVQHLTGVEFFYGRPFEVNKHVLIPRPETEEVVLAALHLVGDVFPPDQPLKAVDVGTGSGAIAITLALEKKITICHSD